jgi:general secretion pathway protein G
MNFGGADIRTSDAPSSPAAGQTAESKKENCLTLNHKSSIFNSRRAGFTLIELMVVIVIIGILAALVAPRLMSRADEAKVTEAKIQIKNLETALRLFKTDNGFYPSTEQGLEALISPPLDGQIPENFREGGYLEKKSLPADPWGNRYIYLSPGQQGEYDIISPGADGQEGGSGYDADIINWEI